MRIQGPLCFANAARTKERILNIKVLLCVPIAGMK